MRKIAIPLAALLVCTAAGGTKAPADLRLQWADNGSALDGKAGDTIDVRFALRNVGGSDAFAVILKTHTTLGPYGQSARLQPGPRAGESLDRRVSLPLATGMKELCVEASLQTVALDEPRDPNLGDNRICRAVTVTSRAPRSES